MGWNWKSLDTGGVVQRLSLSMGLVVHLPILIPFILYASFQTNWRERNIYIFLYLFLVMGGTFDRIGQISDGLLASFPNHCRGLFRETWINIIYPLATDLPSPSLEKSVMLLLFKPDRIYKILFFFKYQAASRTLELLGRQIYGKLIT